MLREMMINENVRRTTTYVTSHTSGVP